MMFGEWRGRLVGAVILSSLGLLSACAGGPARDPMVVTRTVEVPTAVRCRPDLGPDPLYPDTDAALRGASGLYDRVRLLAAGRLLRIAREAEKTAALTQCAG